MRQDLLHINFNLNLLEYELRQLDLWRPTDTLWQVLGIGIYSLPGETCWLLHNYCFAPRPAANLSTAPRAAATEMRSLDLFASTFVGLPGDQGEQLLVSLTTINILVHSVYRSLTFFALLQWSGVLPASGRSFFANMLQA